MKKKMIVVSSFILGLCINNLKKAGVISMMVSPLFYRRLSLQYLLCWPLFFSETTCGEERLAGDLQFDAFRR